MTGRWRATAGVGLLLFLSGCTLGQTANNPQTSPSDQATPSPSPTPTPVGVASPSASPTPTATPAGTGGAVAITSLPFHNGEVGVGYLAVSLGASGGTTPYQWSVSGGTFPPGLALSSDGTVTGKNTKSGHFNFTVKVKDAEGGAATSPAGFGVFTALSVTQPCANQCTVGVGCHVCGGFGTASGGLGPYQYTRVGGNVPAGMTLSGLALKGSFPQSPLGAFYVAIQVSDQFGAHQTVSANWFVYDPATLNGGADCMDNQFRGTCNASGWSYSGGSPTTPPTVTILSWSQYCPGTFCYNPPTGPPRGWSAVIKGNTISISAALPPNTCTQYEAVVTLALIDKGHCATTLRSNQVDIIVTLNNCG